MTLQLTIDASQLQRLNQQLLLLTDRNIRFAVANAMTAAGRKAQAELLHATPRFIDSPTRWTLGGISQRVYAKPANLTINLGFATERRGRGSPAGRYVNPIAAGTRPHPKGADLSASKITRTRGTLIPARSAALTDRAGNVPLQKQAQILSAARLGGQGTFIAPVEKGSRIMAIFERREGLMSRSNTLERFTRRLFTIDPNPKVRQRQFPVRETVEQAFAQAWPQEMAAAFQAELARIKR